MTGTADQEWRDYQVKLRRRQFFMRALKGSMAFELGSVVSYFIALTILTPTHERHETICAKCHSSGYSWREDIEAPAHAAKARKKYVHRYAP